MKTIWTALLGALVLAAGAGAAPAVTVEPGSAVVGGTITVSGPPGDVELEPLTATGPRYPLGRIGADGRLEAEVPQLPVGSYRVIVARSREAPVLEVVALSGQTSTALVVFGVLFMVALLVGGVILHRRWRDAIS